MIIGRKDHTRGTWSYGIEFSMTTPLNKGTTPRFEIWWFKLLSYPPKGEVLNKNRDIKGFWKIFWIERTDPVVVRTNILKRKGFRDRVQEVKVPSRMSLRHW